MKQSHTDDKDVDDFIEEEDEKKEKEFEELMGFRGKQLWID